MSKDGKIKVTWPTIPEHIIPKLQRMWERYHLLSTFNIWLTKKMFRLKNGVIKEATSFSEGREILGMRVLFLLSTHYH